MESKTIPVPDGSIHILTVQASVTSTSLPVVFIHGMACSANLWETQLAYVAPTRSAIALDLRGHGASPPPIDDDYSPASRAADLFAVLAALNLDQIALVGHSYGSCVALAAAAAQPQRIAQLILVDPPIDCTQIPPAIHATQIAPLQAALQTDEWRSTLEQSFQGALTGGTPTTHDYIMARLAATPQSALIGTSHGFLTFGAVEALDRYLAASGKQVHAILAPSNNLPFSLHRLRPALKTITLPETSHWLMLDAPEAFAQALKTCLGNS